MTRIMLLTFAVLAWAWYEMSGGSEFEAGSNGVTLLARVDTSVLPPADQQVARSDTLSASLATVAVGKRDAGLTQVADPLIKPDTAKVADVVLPTVQDADEPAAELAFAPPEPRPAFVPQVASANSNAVVTKVTPAAQAAVVAAAPTGGVPDVSVDPGVIQEAVIAAATSIDFRTVTGSAVNLRGGPSTSYGVVTQLLRGEQVEVLDDTGDGWVKLRAVDGDAIGWMSDAFLVASN